MMRVEKKNFFLALSEFITPESINGNSNSSRRVLTSVKLPGVSKVFVFCCLSDDSSRNVRIIFFCCFESALSHESKTTSYKACSSYTSQLIWAMFWAEPCGTLRGISPNELNICFFRSFLQHLGEKPA